MFRVGRIRHVDASVWFFDSVRVFLDQSEKSWYFDTSTPNIWRGDVPPAEWQAVVVFTDQKEENIVWAAPLVWSDKIQTGGDYCPTCRKMTAHYFGETTRFVAESDDGYRGAGSFRAHGNWCQECYHNSDTPTGAPLPLKLWNLTGRELTATYAPFAEVEQSARLGKMGNPTNAAEVRASIISAVQGIPEGAHVLVGGTAAQLYLLLQVGRARSWHIWHADVHGGVMVGVWAQPEFGYDEQAELGI